MPHGSGGGWGRYPPESPHVESSVESRRPEDVLHDRNVHKHEHSHHHSNRSWPHASRQERQRFSLHPSPHTLDDGTPVNLRAPKQARFALPRYRARPARRGGFPALVGTPRTRTVRQPRTGFASRHPQETDQHRTPQQALTVTGVVDVEDDRRFEDCDSGTRALLDFNHGERHVECEPRRC